MPGIVSTVARSLALHVAQEADSDRNVASNVETAHTQRRTQDIMQGEVNTGNRKDLLFLPANGQPCLVRLDREAVRRNNYSPFLDPRYLGLEGLDILRKTYMLTDPPENYAIIYYEQLSTIRLPLNVYLSDALGALSGGLARPWYGSMLVEYQSDEDIDPASVRDEVEQVVEHIHSVYERIHPAESVQFDRMPVDESIRYFSVDEFMELYGREFGLVE
ncbi:hypothetical protein VNI00_015228 [Paramarasmius palmivorus]|uniref:Uncharacterized protein n=1 Tax=Paramarasmius palmivorus TaxID=297713 RepID=A0AAW0BLL4_9AGAR